MRAPRQRWRTRNITSAQTSGGSARLRDLVQPHRPPPLMILAHGCGRDCPSSSRRQSAISPAPRAESAESHAPGAWNAPRQASLDSSPFPQPSLHRAARTGHRARCTRADAACRGSRSTGRRAAQLGWSSASPRLPLPDHLAEVPDERVGLGIVERQMGVGAAELRVLRGVAGERGVARDLHHAELMQDPPLRLQHPRARRLELPGTPVLPQGHVRAPVDAGDAREPRLQRFGGLRNLAGSGPDRRVDTGLVA